ncbi:MAG: hypothetical protein AAGF47_00910 [Planctomycetota bacterium]
MTIRRGGIYVLVLSVSAVTMSIGLIGFSSLIAQREVVALADDSVHAAQLAESAIQLAVQRMAADGRWRTFAGGEVVAPTPFEGGSISATVDDPADDDLTNDDTQPIRITGRGTVGVAERVFSVVVEPETRPLGVLDVAIAVRGGMTGVDRATTTTLVWGVPFRGGHGSLLPIHVLYSSSNMSWIEQPSPSIVAQYAAMGTVVPLSASRDGNGNNYEGLELSPTAASSAELSSLPTDPNGVYVIDAGGNTVRIDGGSIEGTLVVINAAGSKVCIVGLESIEPNEAGYPVILTDGNLELEDMHASTVKEPWPGPEDEGFDDPAFDGIRGMIYTSGDIAFKDNVDVLGIVIAAGEGVVEDELRIKHDPRYQDDPPPGFFAMSDLRLRAGSWRSSAAD